MVKYISVITCLFMIMVTSCVAFDFTVGDLAGWTVGFDFNSWIKGKTFKVGDNLVFKYSKDNTVVEVDLGEYTSCTLGNSISKVEESNKTSSFMGKIETIITLETPGTHYFISADPVHCTAGMKFVISVSTKGESATPTPTCNGCPPLPPPNGNSATDLNFPWRKSGSARAGLSNVPPFVAILLLALVLL